MTTVCGIVTGLALDVPPGDSCAVLMGGRWVRVSLNGQWNAVLFDDARVHGVNSLTDFITDAGRPVHAVAHCDPDNVHLVAYNVRFTT